ncbi:MAG: UbiA family prenyltransferase, partial [Oscillospiraceae bacterium]|nr:UbiA family prenyltransferase [Oscillospiraceae bacterium]
MLHKLRSYLSLLRIRHWIKNSIILIPAFYGGVILQQDMLLRLVIGFFSFSLCSSAIYAINDLCDIEKDRSHPVKCKRPLASGAVSKTEGVVLICICVAGMLLLNWLLCGISLGALIPVLYLLLNLLYSFSW